MLAPWVIEEAKNVDFKDKRLNERFTGLLSELGSHPSKSIPACYGGGAAEVTAAYRFFDNDKVCFENVLQSHVEGTRRRVAEHEIVILAQDTTELDLTRPDQQVVGAGPLDGGRRRGVFLHPLHAFTPDGTPLGTLRADVWAREEAAPSPAKTPAEKRKELLARPIEEKESYRWIETMQCASEEAQRATETHFVCVSDSEADIYELLADAQQSPQNMDWIVRACQNRRLQGNSEKSQENIESQQPAANFMCERVEQEPVLFTHTVSVRGRKPKVGCDKRKRRQARTSRKAPRPLLARGDGECGVGSRNRSTSGRRTGGMDSPDTAADRQRGRRTESTSILHRTMAHRSLLQDTQERLPCGGPTL
jgi:hypothetical protein